MRPLELIVEGFRSFEQRASFDFRGRQLIGVVGPIGSGKSSLLDAIAFALYARTPRIERDVISLIRHGADEARVELLFEAAGSTWRAIRVIRRRGANLHALVRFAGTEEGGERSLETTPIERLDRAREIDLRLARLLGLDFTAFCRSVLLAQNQFAEFLEARPGDRDAVLKGLFGFERLDAMRERGQQRVADRRVEVARLEGQLSELEALRASLPGLRERAAVSERRRDQLASVREAAEALAARRRESAEVERAVAARLLELERIGAELPQSEVVAALAEGESARRTALGAAQQALEQASTALAAAAVEERRAALDLCTTSAACADAELAAAEQLLDAARTAESAAADDLSAARVAVEAARKGLAAAERAEQAAVLRATLEVGAPCPVCGVEVAQHAPLGEPSRELCGARADLSAGEGRLAAAEAAVAATTRAAASAAAAADAARRARERCRAELEHLASEGPAAVADQPVAESARAEPSLATAGERAIALRSASERARAARASATRAREALSAASAAERARREELAGLGTELAELRGRLDHLAGRLGVELVPASGLPDRFARLLEARAAALDAGRMEAARAAANGQEAAAALAALAAGLDLPAGADIAAAALQAAAAAELAANELAAATRRLAAAEELTRELESARQALATWAGIVEDLKPSRFLRHLLDEERRALGDLAGERFEVLSAGRYRFAEDGSFDVLDLANGEERRPIGTLSGGETFLASLALALALAEMVTGGGGRLDAFFLDEGFGALDPEHLRLALEGIERLAVESADRLVVVVSHVAEVRERFDDLIELDRDPLSGASRVLRG